MNKKFLSLLFLIVLLCNIETVHAEKLSLSITPVTTHLISKPGKTISLPVALHNSGDPVTAKLLIRKLVPDTDGKLMPSIDSLDPFRFSLNNSQLLLNNPFLISAKDSLTTTLVIQVPEAAQNKDYYYGLFFESEASPAPEGTATVNFRNSLASMITISLTQTGELHPEPDIALFSVVSDRKISLPGKTLQLFDTSDDVPLKIVLHNTGKNTAYIQGKVQIESGNTKIKSIPLLRSTILSETQKEIPINELDKLGVGHYKATLTLVDVHNNNSQRSSTAEFYVLPLLIIKIMVSVLSLTLLFVSFYIFRLYRRSK